MATEIGAKGESALGDFVSGIGPSLTAPHFTQASATLCTLNGPDIGPCGGTLLAQVSAQPRVVTGLQSVQR